MGFNNAMGIIIAFSGSHGTGKTTAVYGLAAALKKRVRGDVGVILEVARQCPLPYYRDGQKTTRAAQMWIFTEQIRREIEALQHYPLVVSDRTCVDAIAYSSVAGFHDLAYAMLAMARHHVGIYHRVLFRGTADNPYCTPDSGRHQDMDLRREVELRMLELYRDLGVDVVRQQPAI